MSETHHLHTLAQLVPEGSRVLDLGCGDGALLEYLQKHRACSGYGVELDDANVLALPADIFENEVEKAVGIIETWVNTPYESIARRTRRIKEMDEL